jgi:hypothetical protein
MNEAMVKSLSDLIDETLQEIEELKKSSMSAQELDLSKEGPGESLNEKAPGEGKSAQGGGAGLMKEEKEEHEEKESEEEEHEEHEEEGEEEEEEGEEKKKKKKPFPFAMKKEEEAKEMAKEEHEMVAKEESKDYMGLFKKSEQEVASLRKSVDERLAPMEDKLNSLFEMVTKIANSPVAAKGLTARSVVPLQKSEEAAAPLTRESVTDKLFELKKSGVSVPAEEFIKIDLGSDLGEIVKKYNLK